MIDPRRRALRVLAGGAFLPTDEVDVSSVEVMPEAVRADLPPLRRPSPPEVSSGAPVDGVVTNVDEYAEALRQKHEREFQQSLGGIGSGIIEAFTGVGRKPEASQQAAEYANEPIAQYLQRQKEADKAREMELRAPRATATKPQKSTDPSSPESKRAQAVIASTLGDQYTPDEIAQMSEADADSVMKYGSMKRTAEVGREAEVGRQKRFTEAQLQRARIHAENLGFKWADMDQDEQLAWAKIEEARASREALAARHAADTGLKLAERNVGGFETDPKNPPSADGSKKMAEVAVQSKTITQGLESLERMYRESGTEIAGATSGTMAAEWKNLTDLLRNISNMGVPNGKDYEMLAMQLENPTELRSFTTSKARGLAQMKTVREQIRRIVAATAEAYKFRPASTSPVAPRKPAASVLPQDASGQPTIDTPPPRRKRDKSGQLWEEQPDGTAKKVPG